MSSRAAWPRSKSRKRFAFPNNEARRAPFEFPLPPFFGSGCTAGFQSCARPLVDHAARAAPGKPRRGIRPAMNTRTTISRKYVRRAQSLARIVRTIAAHVAGGMTVLEALRRMHRRKRGHSVETLRRHYYRWLRAGRADAVLRAKYGHGSGFAWTDAQRERLWIVLPSATSFADLHGKLFKGETNAPGYTQFHRSFPAAERQALCRHFAAQRRTIYTARRFARWMRGPERTFATKGGGK